MPQIYIYNLYLFGKDEPIELDQVKGQKLAMELVNNPEKRFMWINGTLVNTASIDIMPEKKKMYIDTNSGSHQYLPEVRELTEEEQEVQEKFDEFRGIKLIK